MANVTFTPNHQPAPACYPSDVNGMLDMLTTGGGLSGTIPDTAGGGVFVGSSPPSSALTQKVWYKTDGAGRPLGVFMFYNGNWRKVYTGAGYGEVRLFAGNPSGFFDGTGRGILGGDWDGWALCTGSNGTPNLSNRFVVAAEGWNGAWLSSMEFPGVSSVASGGQGGAHMIDRTKLPKLTSYAYGSLVAAPGSGAYAVANAGQTIVGDWPVIDINGNPVDGVNQQPMPYPPYYALAYVMFIGYQ
jgi:hypothetical protein